MKDLIAAAAALGLILFAALAFSAEVPFNQAQFDATRAAGKPIAVVFHADWCLSRLSSSSTCPEGLEPKAGLLAGDSVRSSEPDQPPPRAR